MATIEPYENKSGRKWRVRYRKPDGTQTCKRGFVRKLDADRWAAEHVTTAIARGSYVDPQAGRRRIEDMWPAWIASKKASSKPSYVSTLERTWRKWVAPTWGKRSIAGILHSEVQTWIGQLTSEGMSATLVHRCRTILSGILDAAVLDNLIASNPCEHLDMPKRQRSEHVYLTATQLMSLANASGWRKNIVLTLGLTGLRWGELVGLQVGDVDIQRRRIQVRRNATEVDNKIIVGSTKTDEWRTISYPRILDDIISNACAGHGDEDILFADPKTGGFLRRVHGPNSTSSWFFWAKKRAGFEGRIARLTIHDLRHTAASLMVHAGANVKAVQRQLGHASAAMTLDVYADLFDDDLDVLSADMDAMLEREIDVSKMCPENNYKRQ